MSKLLFAVLLFCWSALLWAQEYDASCCRMSAASDPAVPGLLKISILNLHQSLVTVHETSAETDFDVKMMAEDGRGAGRTEYFKRLLNKERGGRMILKNLTEGDSMSQTLDLRKLYDLEPGTYHVSVARSVVVGGGTVVLKARAVVRIPER
jgi:hypothetical protein